ncbi:MAG: aspartate carbamoyltransferase [archaeon]
MSIKGKDILTLTDLTKEDIDYILKQAERCEKVIESGKSDLLKGKILATLFFEPSTRTRLSFESAMLRLGGSVIGFSDTAGTSVKKGENLADTIRTVEQYCDVIAMRHPVEGSAKHAADVSKVPILNGGDGPHAHPTQTLLDLYTMIREKGKIKGLKVAITGDLKYGRTAHSLSAALAMLGADMVFASPKELKMPRDFTISLKHKFEVEIEEKESLSDVVGDVDVLYVTRIQKERFPAPEEYERVKSEHKVDIELLEKAKEGMIVMHPLPRVYEIDSEVDNTKFARYFQQAYYGVPVRMALLAGVLGVEVK